MGFEGKITPESPKHERMLLAEMPLDESNRFQMQLSEIVFDRYNPNETDASGGTKMLWWIQHGYAKAFGDLEYIDVADPEATLDDVEANLTRH